MGKQTICTFTEQSKQRIEAMAKTHISAVSLKVRHGSGKTLLLEIIVPGWWPKVIVRAHRKMHKAFYAFVKAAQEFLAAYKALHMPIAVESASTAAALAVAVAKLPAKRDTLYKNEVDKQKANTVASHFYKGKDIYGPGLRKMAQEAGLG